MPTPLNAVDASAVVSPVGNKLSLGPNIKTVITRKETEDAINAKTESVSSPGLSKKSTLKLSHTVARESSPSPARGSNRHSSPKPSPAQKSIMSPEAVIAEYQKERAASKESINLVVVGHVDAGKSTLMGRLLCDLGYVSQKVMHRNETDSKKMGKSSFMYAWVLDETEEERMRGITMDVAQSKFETGTKKITILDAPGHKDFIPNMITGAASADAAILVIDATNGEFEAGFDVGGQTREHAMLVRSLGISQLAVCVNKLDNVNWSKDRYNEIVEKLKAFLKSAGYKEADVKFVPCCGLSGENLIRKSTQADLTSWYSGPCLIEVIDSFKAPAKAITKPFRLAVADIFKGLISGVSVSGRIEAGYIAEGQKLLIMPSNETCVVKSISVDDEKATQAFAGDNVVLVLYNTDVGNVTVGSILCDTVQPPCPVSTLFEAKVVIFKTIKIPITPGMPVVIHFNNTSEQAVIKKLVSQLSRSTGQVERKHPRCLVKNTSGVIRIQVSRPICVEVHKDFKELGRFMLRYSGDTIAAGLIDRIIS